MSHLIKIYAVCKVTYFHLWYFNIYTNDQKFCVAQFLVLIFEMLYDTYGKVKKNLDTETEYFSVSVSRLFTVFAIKYFKSLQH